MEKTNSYKFSSKFHMCLLDMHVPVASEKMGNKKSRCILVYQILQLGLTCYIQAPNTHDCWLGTVI